MPELPEVEVVKRGLEEIFKAKPSILDIEILSPRLRNEIPKKKLKTLINARILSVVRRAKYLVIDTEKGGILSHLGMTGTWRTFEAKQKHDHVYLHLSSKITLAYCDPRRFGVFDFIAPKSEHKLLKNLGPEPFDESLTSEQLWQAFRGKTATIKAAIMNQNILVGVGNIYASEALFAAGIHPQTKAEKVSRDKMELLLKEIRRILQHSIENGGSSIDDFKTFYGDEGGFQNQHLVYGLADEPCSKCQTKIRSAMIVGRSTFWCPSCQKR